jgi:hypothetical protein
MDALTDTSIAQLDQDGWVLLPHMAGCDLRSLYAGLLPIAARWLALMERHIAMAPASCVVPRITTRTMITGDFQPLQQDAGADAFPLQVVTLLSAPGRDFTGGEYVMTEQRPRMQSRPMVVPLQQGDLAILATARRPFQGSKGIYSVSMRHAIGTVRSGSRIGQVVTFHWPGTELRDA